MPADQQQRRQTTQNQGNMLEHETECQGITTLSAKSRLQHTAQHKVNKAKVLKPANF